MGTIIGSLIYVIGSPFLIIALLNHFVGLGIPYNEFSWGAIAMSLAILKQMAKAPANITKKGDTSEIRISGFGVLGTLIKYALFFVVLRMVVLFTLAYFGRG